MRVAVLGSVEVLDRGNSLDVGTLKQRSLLAALTLHRARPVSVDMLVDLVWGEAPPPAPVSSLHGYIAGLRRILEPGRGAREKASILVTTASGYALRLPEDAVDAGRFAAEVNDVHRRLATGRDEPAVPGDVSPAELMAMSERLTGALALWRGTPYLELEDAASAVAERVRLEELKLVAFEDLALIRLELGEQGTVVADLTAAAHEYPLRERLWALRALALARAGRQAEALETIRTIRRTLSEELGVDAGPVLRGMEHAVLTQKAPDHASTTAVPRRGGEPGMWPLIGRDAELSTLVDLLSAAADGHAQFATLVGEPGIGKSRLLDELARRAGDAGFVVLVGRCSEDEGAPPFWPWVGVLRELTGVLGRAAVAELAGPYGDRLAALLPPDVLGAVEVEPADVSIDAERFLISDAIARLLAEASARRPLLIALDDLHWADRSSLRLLRHLVEHPGSAGMLVVATRRAHPEPAGPLAEVVAALGRRHAARLELTGLPDAAVGEFVTAVTGAVPVAQRVALLRERTDGNPFFLVELLRLDQAGRDDIPAALSDVVARRVAGLPAPAQALLRTASAIGRHFDVDLLAAAIGGDPEAVLDDLDPALAVGVVQEESSPGRFRFAHALVRDVVYRGLTASRRAQRHAAIARALTPATGGETSTVDMAGGGAPQSETNQSIVDGRLSEAARHWLAAGPSHARLAWHTAVRAAAQARRLHGHDEATALLDAARAAQADDPVCGPAERYEVLMAQAEACRWVGDRIGQLDALDDACRAATELGDVPRLARAAVSAANGSLWSLRDWGVVHQPAIAALRLALRELPEGDSDLRCRVLLTLAAELHYAPMTDERDALAEDGLAMARRIGDPALLAWAAMTAFVAIWRTANAEQRWQLVDKTMAATGLLEPVPDDRPADQVARTHLLTLRAVAAMETGRVAQMWQDMATARAEAERLRLPFPLGVLNFVETPMRAMQGRFADAERLLAENAELAARTSLPAKEYFAIATVFVRMWQGRAAEFLPELRLMYEAAPVPWVELYVLVLLRAGERDELDEVIRRGQLGQLSMPWTASADLSIAAYAAYVLRLKSLAAETYQGLAHYAGRLAYAGSGGIIGPVDAYLALAAAAAGEPALATRHADDALALAAKWELPLVADWLTGLRADGGF